MSKQAAENLVEMLERYIEDVEEHEANGTGERGIFYDDHILDGLLTMQQSLHDSGIEEGRKFGYYASITDTSMKLFDKIKVVSALSGKEEEIFIASLLSVKMVEGGDLMHVHFLGCKV